MTSFIHGPNCLNSLREAQLWALQSGLQLFG